MKYKAKVNMMVSGVSYEMGKEYDEKDIPKGVDMNDFEPMDSTNKQETVETAEKVDEAEGVELSKLSKKELHSFAIENTNLDPYEYKSKADLLEAIEKALK